MKDIRITYTYHKKNFDLDEEPTTGTIVLPVEDLNTTNWPWNMVAAFPEDLPVWMPLPKKPDGVLRLQEGKDGQG